MAISAATVWRVRIGGDNANGGGYDATISGATTDYSEQDAAQLSASDLATSGISSTVTSAAGGFTAAMIGNALKIASGTNFTAGTYFIVTVTNTNTAVLDRNCSTGVGASGVAKVGGAHASITQPNTSGAVAGNVVMIRGQGSNDPADIDYANVSITAGGNLTYVGYNGRPKISHGGRGFYLLANVVIKNLFLVQVAGTNTGTSDAALCGSGTGSNFLMAINCVFDTGGFDVQSIFNANAYQCTFMNSGPQTVGVRYAINNSGASGILNCIIKDQRYRGALIVGGRSAVQGCIFQNNLDAGLAVSALNQTSYASAAPISGNTFYGNGSHGLFLSDAYPVIFGNLFSDNVGYGIFQSGTDGAASAQRIFLNNFHNNTSGVSNFTLSSDTTTLNPAYFNAPTDLTPTNIALRYTGGVGSQ